MNRKNISKYNTQITHIEGKHIGPTIDGYNNSVIEENLNFSTTYYNNDNDSSEENIKKNIKATIKEAIKQNDHAQKSKNVSIGPTISGLQNAKFYGNAGIDANVYINNNKSSTEYINSNLSNQKNHVSTNNDIDEKRNLELLEKCINRNDPRPQHRETLAKYSLTQEEKNLLKKFKDPISKEYMNIPVRYQGDNETFYDLDTLLNLVNSNEIKRSEIKVGLPEEIKLKNIVKKIENNHKNDVVNSAELNNSFRQNP